MLGLDSEEPRRFVLDRLEHIQKTRNLGSVRRAVAVLAAFSEKSETIHAVLRGSCGAEGPEDQVDDPLEVLVFPAQTAGPADGFKKVPLGMITSIGA